MRELLAATPARIGLGRAGVRYDTRSYLSFRMDHAAARDAIFTEVGQAFLDQLGAVILESRVTDRRQYLLRPDLGRRLAPASERLLLERCRKGASVQLLVVDGLSGRAVEAGALDFIRAFQAGLQVEGLADRTGTPIFVRMGRVAVMDQIGDLLKPDLVVELVGERPGLVTAESMSAYFCYRPNLSTVESDRMLISNIHRGGIPPVEAGAYGARLAAKILAAGVSGVKLTQ
jgi:ethanolamine ammonia-lyase small subunit